MSRRNDGCDEGVVLLRSFFMCFRFFQEAWSVNGVLKSSGLSAKVRVCAGLRRMDGIVVGTRVERPETHLGSNGVCRTLEAHPVTLSRGSGLAQWPPAFPDRLPPQCESCIFMYPSSGVGKIAKWGFFGGAMIPEAGDGQSGKLK